MSFFLLQKTDYNSDIYKHLLEERKKIFEETIKEFMDIKEKEKGEFRARISIINLTNINIEEDLRNKRGYIVITSYPGGNSLIDNKESFNLDEGCVEKTFFLELKWPVKINLLNY